MTSKIALCLTVLTVIAVLAIPSRVAAQAHTDAPHPYILVDLGTLGGPQSTMVASVQDVTNRGTVVGVADTATPDPNYPDPNQFFQLFGSPDPFIAHAFAWHNGVRTDLGALPGTNTSAVYWVNASGDAAGLSTTGVSDTILGMPAADAVVWKDRHIIDLGTFGGKESVALGINNRGQVVGAATNTIPDPYSGFGTQSRAFLWQNGVMHDLGTLGGSESLASQVNDRGQVAGASNLAGQPTVQHAFLWQDGKMTDLGSLGGTFGIPNALNNRSEVVGEMNLEGDQTSHPFLWHRGVLTDLGTFGGNHGAAFWINEAGAVVGYADEPGSQVHDGFLWRQGVMTDLGTLPGDVCSVAWSMNVWGQAVGTSETACGAAKNAFLWEHGAMIDVNTLVAPSALHLADALDINDRGEIAGWGTLPNGDEHAFLLIPTDLAASEGIMQNAPAPGTGGPATATYSNPAPCAIESLWRARLARGYHLPCRGA